jgi:hypothetical protein
VKNDAKISTAKRRRRSEAFKAVSKAVLGTGPQASTQNTNIKGMNHTMMTDRESMND